MVHASQLRPNEQIALEGTISFSHIREHYAGAALDARIAQQKKMGQRFITDKPHTALALTDVVLAPADPNNLTLEEQYIQEKFFTYKKGENAGKIGYSIEDKSNFLPTVFEPDPENPGSHRQLNLQEVGKDLAAGQRVTLVVNTFGSDNYANKGVGIQMVVLHEAPKFYTPGMDTSVLASRGITISGAVTRVAANDAAGSEVPENSTIDADSGLALPGPMTAQPVQQAQPVAQPATPQITAQAAQPIAQQAPAQAPAAPAAAPVQQGETPEQKAARLEAELAALRADQAPAQDNSAFTDGAEATSPAPWDVP